MQLYHNTYLEPALLLAVLGVKPKFEKWYYDTIYYQYACIYREGELIYRDGYLKVYDAVTASGILERFLDIQVIENMDSCNNWTNVIVDWFKAGKYVIIDFDEYYIKNTYFYGRCHYYRKFLLFGYDEDRNIFFACSHDKHAKLVEFKISGDLVETLSRREKDYEKGINNSGAKCRILRPISNMEQICDCSFNLEIVLNNICLTRPEITKQKYEDSYYVKVYGDKVFDAITYRLELLKENIVKLDYRCFRMLSLNKAFLANRILEESKKIGNEMNVYANIFEQNAKILHECMLYLLHYYADCHCDNNVIDMCVKKIQEIRRREEAAIKGILEILK